MNTYPTKYVDIILPGPIQTAYHNINSSFVVPGVNRVHTGQKVEFTALDTDAKLLFPDLDLLDPGSRPKGDFITIPAGGTHQITINPEAQKRVYAYAVITTANKDLAIGGSFPKFIVDNL